LLDSLPNDLAESVIEALEDYEPEFSETSAAAGIVPIASFYGRLPEKPRGMFSIDPDIRISRVVLRLLRSISDEESRARIISAALRELHLFAQYELVSVAGHRENAGSQVIEKGTAEQLEI